MRERPCRYGKGKNMALPIRENGALRWLKMAVNVLALLGLLGGDLKKLLKNLRTVEGFWEYTLSRIEQADGWSEAEKAAGRLVFNEIVAILGLRKILKKEG